ncbi:N-acetyl sugar amidotransferase [Alphaproteobacteria bacterium]|jgi:N-acetyl sugar amidotransferase|nr:N-acetyl sugar amidotransferase [Alphaproteobacteria bacterium]
MKYCIQCILPETRPGLVIDNKGVCSACRGHEDKERSIDWSARSKMFDSIVKRAKETSRDYDCIIPVSGGKDSWYQVIKSQLHGLKILCVSWRTPQRTPVGQENLDQLIKKLGVDHIDFSINPDVEKRFTMASFEKKGATGIPMHMAIFAIPYRLATQLRVPLIIWGENPQLEFGGPEADRLSTELDVNWIANYGVTNQTKREDWIGINELTDADLSPYALPTPADLKTFHPKSIFLGSFFRWDSFENFETATEHGFSSHSSNKKTGSWEFADIDCHFISLHHFLKWHKFGFLRIFDNLSVEIRYGRISRKEAIQNLEKTGLQQPCDDIERFCDFMEKPVDWFWNTTERFRNKDIWIKEKNIWKIPGFITQEWDWEKA